MPGLSHRTQTAIGIACASCLLALAVSVWTVSWLIAAGAAPYVYDSSESLPVRTVGLVLGTSRNTGSGLNQFYTARIEAASDLFQRGKIRHIIVSGSNPSRYYNEPQAMKEDLLELGVPEDCITEDYAGYRTLDSIVRAHKVMGQITFTVITQRFHAERAVYIGRQFGLDVIAYCARDPEEIPYGAKLREYGARIKALLDVTVLDTQPRYLGEPVVIEPRPNNDPDSSEPVD